MTHTQNYLAETISIAQALDPEKVEQMVKELVALRERKGRLFIIGLGGSAANASHAVNDFRKLTGIQAFCPIDNASELTARMNDEGWEDAYLHWVQGYNPTKDDALFVLSVGGGTYHVSRPITNAVTELFTRPDLVILGIVGRDGGVTKTYGDCVIIVPTVNPDRVTPHTEGWQSVILHAIVSHPDLQRNKTKW